MDRRMFRRAIMFLALISVCKGKPHDFGESNIADMSNDPLGSLSTYFWNDKEDTINISVIGSEKFAIFSYDVKTNKLERSFFKCDNNNEESCLISQRLVSAGSTYGCSSGSNSWVYKFTGDEILGQIEARYLYKPFTCGNNVYAFDGKEMLSLKYDPNEVYIIDEKIIDISFDSTGIYFIKVIDDRYLAYLYSSGTNPKGYEIVDIKGKKILHTINVTTENNQYTDIALNDKYIAISTNNIIQLYLRATNKPTDSIVEGDNIIACAFDKNTGLIYYATTSNIICADPEDFKWSSTARRALETGIDNGASEYANRRGDLFIHRSGKVLFSYLHGEKDKYIPKLFSIEVDELSYFSNMNIMDCLDNPIHRVWNLKNGNCELGMSPSTEKDCTDYGCIKGKMAEVKEISPSTGSSEGNTNAFIRVNNLKITEALHGSIKIKLGEAFVSNIRVDAFNSTDSSTTIHFSTPNSSSIGVDLEVNLLINGVLIHDPSKDNIFFVYYDCSKNTDCTTCTAHYTGTKYATECKWCALENKCKGSSCLYEKNGRKLGNCPAFSIPPTQFSAPGYDTELTFLLKAEKENTTNVRYFCKSNESDAYNEGKIVDDVMTCKLPAVDGNVSVNVTTSVGDSEEKVFYAQSENSLLQRLCDTVEDCTECSGYGHCVWHFDEEKNDFGCEYRSKSPAYPYEVCPKVDAVEPQSIEYWIYDGSAIPIEVTMNGEIPQNKTYTCAFTGNGNSNTSTGKWVSANTVSCEIPENFITAEDKYIQVSLTIGNSDKSETSTFYSLQCNRTTEPSMCVDGDGNYDGLCGWCFGENKCSSKCDSKCWVNDGKPKVTSIEPPIFNVNDKTNYTILGSGFVHSDCGVLLQCVLTEEATGKVVKVVDATYVSSKEIHCIFNGIDSKDPVITSSDDDSDESYASGSKKSARRDYIASFKVARAPAAQTNYTLSIRDGNSKNNDLYEIKYTDGTFASIDCMSRDTCSSCLGHTGNETDPFKDEYCRWSVLRGVCTTTDVAGDFTAGRETGRVCPTITGFSTTEAEAGSEVAIVGEGFVDSPKLFISIIDKASGKEVARLDRGNYTYHNTTHISFTFPDLPAGSYGVTLVSSEDGGAVVAANAVAGLVRPKDDKDNTVVIVVCVVVGVIVIAAIVGGVIAFVVRRRAKGGLSGFDFDIKNEPEYAKYKYAASLTNGAKLDKRLGDLIPLLQNPAIACAICDVTQSTETDKVTNSLVYIQASGGCAVPFITTLINEEIPRTPNEKQLFRGDGVISKAFRAYSKIVGLRYLWLTLGRVLNEIDYLARMQDKSAAAARERKAQQDCELSEGVGGASSDISDENAISILDTEVDPSKLSEGANLDAKVHLLYQRCSIVLDPILKSEGNMPPVLRWILHTIYQKVGEVFPGSEHIGIAGTFFLRFVCPSITIPQTYGLLKEAPIESLQRQLTLIAKVLQNTANNCNFGKKEPFMVALNGFVGTNCVKVADFMERIASSQGAQEEKEDVPQDVINASVRFMKGHIANILKKLPAAMEKRGVSQYYQEIADIVSQ